MKIKEAITMADTARPNTMPVDFKLRHLNDLETDLCELLQITTPPVHKDTEEELLFINGWCMFYPLYLMAMIDLENEEMDSYVNDLQAFNAAYKEARQYWMRTHIPKHQHGFLNLL